MANAPNVTPSPSAPPLPGLPAFPQPRVLASSGGLLDITLGCRMATNQVGGLMVNTRTYEGGIGGPTLRVRPGDTLRVRLVNGLPPNPDQSVMPPNLNTPHHFNTTNLHLHGMHVSPQGNGDNVFVAIDPQDVFQYEFRIPENHPQGTYWYHPHKHGAVSMQMLGGMGGALLVEGGQDVPPELRAARDLVYLINELNIDPTTLEVSPFVARPGARDPFPLSNRILTVNGQTQPILTGRSGEVLRLRVIHAGVQKVIPFTIDDHDLNVMAYDGVNLPAVSTFPAGVPVVLAPANRADIVLQFGRPGLYAVRKLQLNTTPPDPEAILGYVQVLPAEGPPMTLPTTLPTPPSLPNVLASEITGRRTITFNVSPTGGPPGFPGFTLNGGLFDPNVVNQTVSLNAVEEWTLLNASPEVHPFHIHINPFQVIAVNGTPLPVPEWHDTFAIPPAGPDGMGSFVMRTRFLDFTGMYVFHCHFLPHEDLGMMQVVNCVAS